MGIFKLFLKSIILGTRSKRRFFPFVVVFAILSGATIILLYNFDNFSREGLLIHRGIVIKTASLDTVTLETAKVDISVTDRDTRTSAVIFYKYVNFGSSLRIFSMNPSYSWAFDEISPTDLKTGSFPKSEMDVLISEDALLTVQDTQAGVNIYTEPVVGTTFKIGADPDLSIELKVCGIYRKSTAIANDATAREWIFITEEAFDTLIESHLNYDDGDIYVHSISIIASGDFISGNVYNNADTLYDDVLSDTSGLARYAGIEHTAKSLKEGGRSFAFLSLIFGMIGTFMVSTLYSYLITRFRRREVAVLKAMGYNAWDVRIVVLCEVLVVAITGYIIGILLIQGYLWNPLGRQSAYFYQFVTFSFNLPFIFPSITLVLSFLAVVISCVPGFFLITIRILAVRPIEIFRQK